MADRTFRFGDDIPAGRSPESFEFQIEEIWAADVTDTLYTDDRAEVDRIVPLMHAQAYDVRVTHRAGQVEYFPAP